MGMIRVNRFMIIEGNRILMEGFIYHSFTCEQVNDMIVMKIIIN